METIPQFIVAAPSSGAGKTTVARGLMALLRGKGLKVQPFKCGPDYIDTKFHTAVCGRPSVNLDLFMASADHVRSLYARYSAGADVCVVEGMMGMYDGYDRDLGSAAHITRVLGLPVLLVVDARSAAYSIAPLLYGFTHFRYSDCVRVAGVIFNNVGSERHRGMLLQVCRDLGIECFGFLPKSAAVSQPSRYLGLDFSAAAADDELVRLIAGNVEWERLLEIKSPKAKSFPTEGRDGFRSDFRGRIFIASSPESFSFLYREHLDILRGTGEVTLFDPAADEPLPPDIGLLYLPGGYPERHAAELSRATRTLGSIRDYAARGGRMLAECGGMMYLCRSIATDDGVFPMAGVLPCDITARTADRRLTLGYRRFSLGGCQLRGHEFHYSRFAGNAPESVVPVTNALGEPVDTVVMRRGNVIAGYTHLYWGETGIERIFGQPTI